jgi:Carboxypeptidase regulatory-like domain
MWLLPLAGALIAGTVTLTDATGAVFAAPGVRITMTCTTTNEHRIAVSDETGAFRFADVSPDTYSMTTDLQGFAPDTAQTTVRRDETTSVVLHLVTVPVRVGVSVAGAAPLSTTVKPSARKMFTSRCRR